MCNQCNLKGGFMYSHMHKRKSMTHHPTTNKYSFFRKSKSKKTSRVRSSQIRKKTTKRKRSGLFGIGKYGL
jgi:hypothetical protein